MEGKKRPRGAEKAFKKQRNKMEEEADKRAK